MSLAETILASLTTTGIIGGLLTWLFKESIKASIKLDLETRLNTQKADLDRVRDSFQFQIQQAMLSIQKQTEKSHEIYPELYEKLRIAEGAAGSLLGLKQVNTWVEYSTQDLEELMERRKVVAGQIEKLVKAIEADRPKGLKQMDAYFSMMEHQQAEFRHHEAKNYITLKSLYMTDEIANDCYQICTNIWSAIVDADIEYRQMASYQKTLKTIEDQMTAVKSKMRLELNRSQIQPPVNP
ncbi:MAG: hypothetical protein ACKOX6_11000 [Bdellovibrio sp.]